MKLPWQKREYSSDDPQTEREHQEELDRAWDWSTNFWMWLPVVMVAIIAILLWLFA